MRDRERDRQTETERDRQRDRETERERERQREGGTHPPLRRPGLFLKLLIAIHFLVASIRGCLLCVQQIETTQKSVKVVIAKRRSNLQEQAGQALIN